MQHLLRVGATSVAIGTNKEGGKKVLHVVVVYVTSVANDFKMIHLNHLQ